MGARVAIGFPSFPIAGLNCQLAEAIASRQAAKQIGLFLGANRGGVGIQLEPAAAIVRRYEEQFRWPRRRQTRR